MMGLLDSMFAQYGNGLLNFRPQNELQVDPWTGYPMMPDQPQGSMAGRVRPRAAPSGQLNSLGNPEFNPLGTIGAGPYDPAKERWARTIPPDAMSNTLTGAMQNFGASMPGFDPSAVQQQAAPGAVPGARLVRKVYISPELAAEAAALRAEPGGVWGGDVISSGAEPHEAWSGPTDSGAAPLMSPQQSALPPGATLKEHQRQNAIQAPPPMPQAREPGIMDRLTAGATNFTTGGNPIAGLLNSFKGLATGERTDSAGVSQANQAQMTRALYGALIQRDIPQAQAFAIAQAASTNPKIAEILLPQALGLKPPSTIEGVIAERMSKGGNGGPAASNDAMKEYFKFKEGTKAAEDRGANGGVNLTSGQKAIDGKFAENYSEWKQGGFEDVQKNLSDLKGALVQLKSGRTLTGPVTGSLPDVVRAVTNPESLAVRDRVTNVVQRNLREILGAQFTQVEGDRLIARAYNERLNEAENARRVENLVKQIQAAAEQKQEAVAYFEKNGTLAGFTGKIPRFSDFDPENDRNPYAPASSRGQLPAGTPAPPPGFLPINSRR